MDLVASIIEFEGMDGDSVQLLMIVYRYNVQYT
jgi:hypothetical protein